MEKKFDDKPLEMTAKQKDSLYTALEILQLHCFQKMGNERLGLDERGRWASVAELADQFKKMLVSKEEGK